MNQNIPQEIRNEMQTSLCGVLQAVIRRLSKDQIKAHSDNLMQLFLSVLSYYQGKFTTATEDVLLSISALATVIEGDFVRYLPHVKPFLVLGLKNSEDYTTCGVSVGLVGDICRAINRDIQPICDEIISILLSNLQNPSLHRDVKPPILSCFGDIALAIGGEFQKYLNHVVTVLQQASLTKVDAKDYDLVDYLNQLREGILEAYTGIVIGMKDDQQASLTFLNFIAQQHIFDFFAFVWQDENKSDAVIKGIIGLIGDMATTYGDKLKTIYHQRVHIKLILNECLKHEDSDIQETAHWVKELIGRWLA